MDYFICPQEVLVQLIDDSNSQPLALPHVAFGLNVKAMQMDNSPYSPKKTDYKLGPYYTNTQGLCRITERDILLDMQSDRSTASLQNYGSLNMYSPTIELFVYATKHLSQIAFSRKTGIWNKLLSGEEEKYQSFEEMIEKIESANNTKLAAAIDNPIIDDWNGPKQFHYQMRVVLA